MDYSDLTQKRTKAQTDAFERNYPTSPALLRKLLMVNVIFGISGAIFLAASATALRGPQNGGIISAVICFLFVLLFASGALMSFLGTKKRREEAARIQAFAAKNNLTYIRTIDNPTYTGMFFHIGRGRAIRNIIGSRTTSPPFEIGNVEYTVQVGRSSHTYVKGYIRIGLDRKLPQIVLDATANNAKLFGTTMTNLPVDFAGSQKMSLEGDFDKYFTLYAPKQYERDALYIFTPDLMALMIDNVSAFDAEIIDDQLFIYQAEAPFNMLDSAVLDRLFKIIQVVGVKTMTQTDAYSDERVGDYAKNEVDIQGRRLKQRVSIIAVIIIAFIIVTFVIAPIVSAVIGATHG